MSEDKEQIRLVDLALDVLEDELECWVRVGTNIPKTTRLIRYPKMPEHFPMSDEAIAAFGEQRVEHIDVSDKDVNAILRRIAMDKVVSALRREFAI
jgi:hypothetical protein